MAKRAENEDIRKLEEIVADAIEPLEPGEDDELVNDLLESNAEFQALVAKSKASPRKPFSPGSGA